MKLDEIKNVLIVGLGLLGGSYAKALTKKGFDVKVITLSQDDINYAVNEGFISGGTTVVDPDLIANSQLIIFALYPHTFIEWIQQYGNLIKPGTVITDVTGVKGCIVEKIQDMLPQVSSLSRLTQWQVKKPAVCATQMKAYLKRRITLWYLLIETHPMA